MLDGNIGTCYWLKDEKAWLHPWATVPDMRKNSPRVEVVRWMEIPETYQTKWRRQVREELKQH